MINLRPALFLDRDGVIIENRANYVRSVTDVAFIPGALAALRRLATTPYAVVIVTNQSAVGRGLITREAVQAVHTYLQIEIQATGGRIDGIYFCPHAPQEGCRCRKPAPGMLLQAAAELGLELAASAMIGDNITDVQAAQAAGARPILVRTGLGEQHAQLLASGHYAPIPIAADLAEAVTLILAGQHR
jgi:D-glycero-D-manno-heptose 1,7-bisphosphate phosphatase